MDDVQAAKSSIRILYGTVTGNSEVLAKETAQKLTEIGLNNRLSGTDEFDTDELYDIETLLLIISTDSGGVPPLMAEDLYQFLDNKSEADLPHLSYSVLALGDSYYPNFCQAGKDFDIMLENLGANRLTERVDCDIHFWGDFESWLDNVYSVIKKSKLS